ncbi:MAG: hypothetical protein OXE56_11595 [Gammaproteobacteria bacterium]|nr:hypothetical protein [Gammaproteobacteria bacterium]
MNDIALGVEQVWKGIEARIMVWKKRRALSKEHLEQVRVRS